MLCYQFERKPVSRRRESRLPRCLFAASSQEVTTGAGLCTGLARRGCRRRGARSQCATAASATARRDFSMRFQGRQVGLGLRAYAGPGGAVYFDGGDHFCVVIRWIRHRFSAGRGEQEVSRSVRMEEGWNWLISRKVCRGTVTPSATALAATQRHCEPPGPQKGFLAVDKRRKEVTRT